MSKDCNIQFTCESCTDEDCDAVGVITSTSTSCGNNQMCELVDGHYMCVQSMYMYLMLYKI